MSNHTPPPDGSTPPSDPYSTPKVPPGPAPAPDNPYAAGGTHGVPPMGAAPYPGPYPPHPGAEPPLTPSEERTWVLLSHLSFLVLPVIGPLIVMLVFDKRSARVRTQAVEALNFHLTITIVALVSIPLAFVLIGFLTLFAAVVYGMVMSVIAAVQTSDGVDYRYPLTLRMVN